MKKVSELSTSIKSIRELQALLPSLIYIICIPIFIECRSLTKFEIWMLISLSFCILSSYIAWLISKTGKQNYAFRYSRLVNRFLLILLFFQIIFYISIPMYYREILYILILVYIPFMVFYTCAAIMNLPFYMVFLIFSAELFIVYLNHNSITILAALFLLPIVDWLSEGLNEALKYGSMREINYLLSLRKIYIIKFVVDYRMKLAT